MAQKVALNSFSRVFIIEGRARPDHEPDFQSCVIAGAVEQNFGDVTDIECPDPNEYGKFQKIGQIRGAEERATVTLTGRYAADIRSELLRLARKGCAVDVHIHFGTCSTPSDFKTFTKAVVLEDAILTNYSTEDLGALESGNQAGINESTDISATALYEVLPVSVVQKASDLTLNSVIDVTSYDSRACGSDCQDDSDGCEKFFAVASPSTGSPGTNPDVIYTLDGGATWQAVEVTTLTAAQEPTGIAGVAGYVVVISNDAGSLSYADRADFDGTTAPEWTEVTTGFNVSGAPNAIASVGNKAFVVGDGGYIYSTDDPTGGVTELDAGVATSDNLNDVDALDDTYAVAVGENGAVVYTEDGVSWAAASAEPVNATLNAVLILSKGVWLVGAANGNLYYTVNGGVSWSSQGFTGSGSGSVTALAKSPAGVIWLAHQTASTAGRLLRSYDGGNQWTVLPEGVGSIPANDKINAIATCLHDPNRAVAAGLADNATAGVLLLASD